MSRIPEKIRIYRKIRHQKGYGIHSPFVYNLITKVVEEKSPYYIFDEIEKVRQELLHEKELVSYIGHSPQLRSRTVGQITAKECHSRKYGALLFRLVNFYKCTSVFNLGASAGMMSFYLASSSKNCWCIAFERRKTLVDIAQKKAEQLGLTGLTFQSEFDKDSYLQLKTNFPSGVDLIFLDLAYDPELALFYFEKSLHFCHDNTIIVVDGINKNKKMEHLWKDIKENPKTGMTLDLHYLGIIFFNNKIYKKNYISYFDYGEKPDLYKKRRWRVHFTDRREKSTKDLSSTRSVWFNRRIKFLYRFAQGRTRQRI